MKQTSQQKQINIQCLRGVLLILIAGLLGIGCEIESDSDEPPRDVEPGDSLFAMACTSILIPPLQGVSGTNRRAVCVPAGQCDLAVNGNLASDILGAHCAAFYPSTCSSGTGCPTQQECTVGYDASDSQGITVQNCAAVAAPACPAGQVRCGCDVIFAAGSTFDCDCGCS